MSANRKYRERTSLAVWAIAGVGYRRGPGGAPPRPRPRSRSSAGITPQPLQLDADRAPAIFELVVLGDLLDGNFRVVPHMADVLESGANVLEPLLRTVGCQPLLKLPKGPLHEALCLFRCVDPEQVEGHVVAGQELRLHDERRAHRDLVDRADLDVGLLEDHAVADHIDASPAGPSHQLRQLAGGEV